MIRIHKEAERVGEKRRPKRNHSRQEMAICGVLREMGDTNLKNEKGDGDGEYAIAECLHSGSGLCQPRNRTPDAKIVAQVPALGRLEP